MRKVTDYIINTILWIASYLRSRGIHLYKQGRLSKILKKYDLVVDDEFESLDSWNNAFWWGTFHPDELKWINNKDNLWLSSDGAHFNTKHDPKDHEGKIYNYSYACIEHKDTFWHGYFEVSATVEPGKHLWHAPLWFVSKGNPDGSEFAPVVPELDVCETYSEFDGSGLRSNSAVHYGKTYEEGVSLRAISHPLPDLANRAVTYGALWNKDRIEIYYDRWLVRVITRKDVVSRFTKKLMPIIGSGVKREKYVREESEMIVHYFRYYKEK